MQQDENKTIQEILSEIPSDENLDSEITEGISTTPVKNIQNVQIEKGDDKLNSQNCNMNVQFNKKELKEQSDLSFENLITAYETNEYEKKTKTLKVFFDSTINMFNNIIISYQSKFPSLELLSDLNIDKILENIPFYLIRLQRLLDLIVLGCPENNEKIFAVIEKERSEKKTIFENLINFKFGELYEYFIQNCTIITHGWYIYNLTGEFKTIDDIIKENKDLKKSDINELKDLEKSDKMEIDTINLENSQIDCSKLF